ncbi:hypothetical protein THERMOT_753 [Bathymodiolus thermophilus thioautotrophic gill symbiont]|nr:hypothetical protein THERMOT_753 [Bathymodiolus thermophilus thioautotrophic gill symbiont]
MHYFLIPLNRTGVFGGTLKVSGLNQKKSQILSLLSTKKSNKKLT